MTRYRPSILFVDDEPALRQLALALLKSDYVVHVAATGEEAQMVVARHSIDIVMTDQQLPVIQGIPLLEWVREHSPRSVRVLMTGQYSLDEAVDAINNGVCQRFLFKPWKPEQLVNLVRNAARTFLLEQSHENLLTELRRLNLDLEERVAERTRELAHTLNQLEQRNNMLRTMALTDALTGLPNRRAIDRLAKTELLRRARTPKPFSLMLVDADHFKDINTIYLHDGGDHVLHWLSSTLASAVRAIDTVGRVGGEEFMIVAPETDFQGAYVLAERIRETVEQSSTMYKSHEIQITVSIGVAVAPEDVLPPYEQIRHQAGQALSMAKNNGRNRVELVEIPIFAGPSAK
ncbi:MAG: diguanylate cyclase [Zavarzinella sp.]